MNYLLYRILDDILLRLLLPALFSRWRNLAYLKWFSRPSSCVQLYREQYEIMSYTVVAFLKTSQNILLKSNGSQVSS